MRAAASAKIDMDVLLAREAQQFLDAFLASGAGLLVAAEGCAEEMLRYLIDPYETRLDSCRRTMGGDEIIGPDGAGQSVLVIHLRQHLVLVAPFENGEDWAE